MTIFAPSEDPLAVTLLVLPDCSMMSVASAIDPMRAANRLSRRPLFSWDIYTLDGYPVVLTCGIPVPSSGILTPQAGGDVLIIIAGFDSEHHAGKSTLALIRKLTPRFQAIGGVEAGSWLLARAGLLEGVKATTHWEDLENFATQNPYVNVLPDRFVIDGRFFTSGGASPTFDLMLHLIRSRFGYPLALEVASVFIYDEAHTSTDAQPLVSIGRLKDHEPRLARAIGIMESHVDSPLPIPAIAGQLGLSSRMLDHLFNRHLGCPPGRFYLRLRLQIARRLVVDTGLSFLDVSVRTGFSSLSAFSRAYKTHYQSSPSQTRKGET